MSQVLGIDVGGTATRWVLIDADGTPSCRGEAPGATGLLNENAQRALAASLAAVAGSLEGSVAAIHAGITGYGRPARTSTVALLSSTFRCRAEAVGVTDDVELAYRAHFRPGEGHLISAGTGIIGLHLTADEEIVRVGGRGILVDDAGSGSWLGLQALKAVFREIDEAGRPERLSILADVLFTTIGADDWDGVRDFVYGGDRGRIASLAPTVALAARRGDPEAARLIAAVGSELTRLAATLVARAGVKPVALRGGVLSLDPSIAETVRAALPDVPIERPVIDTALAAAGFALNHSGLRA